MKILLFIDDQILIQECQAKLQQSVYGLCNIGKMYDTEISFKDIESYHIQSQVHYQG